MLLKDPYQINNASFGDIGTILVDIRQQFQSKVLFHDKPEAFPRPQNLNLDNFLPHVSPTISSLTTSDHQIKFIHEYFLLIEMKKMLFKDDNSF